MTTNPTHQPGDIVNGHVLSADGTTWLRLDSGTTRTYTPGAVVSGHVLTEDRGWVRLAPESSLSASNDSQTGWNPTESGVRDSATTDWTEVVAQAKERGLGVWRRNPKAVLALGAAGVLLMGATFVVNANGSESSSTSAASSSAGVVADASSDNAEAGNCEVRDYFESDAYVVFDLENKTDRYVDVDATITVFQNGEPVDSYSSTWGTWDPYQDEGAIMRDADIRLAWPSDVHTPTCTVEITSVY